MKDASFYNYDYYERGLLCGVSNYNNYHWMPNRSIPEAEYIAGLAGIPKSSFILDFGCAKGFLVKAFFLLGYPNLHGCDISRYAIENADLLIKSQCRLNSHLNIVPYKDTKFDLITAVHVLEHIDKDKLPYYLAEFRQKTKMLFVRVPLGYLGWYSNPKHRNDISHIIAENIYWWETIFSQCGFDQKYIRAHQYSNSLLEDEADFLLI